jgi:CRP/FNR family transcriptional regulator, cyclic AMP receptor protein
MHFRDSSQKVELLRSVPLFQRLSKRHLNEVARHADEVSAEPGKVLMREGELGRELLVIASGAAQVSRRGQAIATLGAGDFVGEMALLDGGARSATVVAREPMVLLVVGARELKPLLRAVPDLAEALLQTLASRLRAADEALTH